MENVGGQEAARDSIKEPAAQMVQAFHIAGLPPAIP